VKDSPYDLMVDDHTKRPAWQKYGDDYSKFHVGEKDAPYHSIMAYFTKAGRALWYNMPFGRIEELGKNVQVNAENTPCIKPDLYKIVTTTDRKVIFYDRKAGMVSMCEIVGPRQLGTPELNSKFVNKKWKYILPLDVEGQPRVLFYQKDNGHVQLRRTLGTELVLVAEGKWDANLKRISVVQIGERTALFLYSSKGTADVCYVDAQCALQLQYTIPNMSKNWKFAVGLTPDQILLFEKKSGVGRIMHLGANQSRVIKDAKADSKTWMQCEYIAHNRQLVFYNSKNGQAVFYNWDAETSGLTKSFIVDSGWSGVKFISQSY